MIELWSDTVSTPTELRVRLVDQVFAHPSVPAHHPVLVCAPCADTAVITRALQHLPSARTRAAGTTCLIEGRP